MSIEQTAIDELGPERSVKIAPSRGHQSLFSLRSFSVLSTIVSLLVIILFSLGQMSFSTLVAYSCFGGVGFAISFRFGATAARIFNIVFGIAIVAAVVLYSIYLARYGSPYMEGGSDDKTFELDGAIVAQSHSLYYDANEIGWLVDHPYHNSKGYIYLVSLFIRFSDIIGGFHTMIPRIFNCMVLGLIAVFVFSTSKELRLSDRGATISALACGLFPMMLWTTIHTFRDIIVGLMLIMVFRFAMVIRPIRQPLKSFIATAAIIFLFFVMMEFRILNILVIIGIASTTLYVRFMSKIPYWGLFFPGVIITATTISYFIIIDHEMVLLTDMYITSYAEHRATFSPGLSKTLFNLSFPLNIFGRIGYSIVSPLPIIYGEIERNIISAGTILQILFAPYLVLGIYTARLDKEKLPLLVTFAITYAGYTLGSFTGRHLTQLIPFAVILIGLGYQRYAYMRNMIFAGSAGIIWLLAIIYIALKNYI